MLPNPKRKPRPPKTGTKERKPSTATLTRKLDEVFSLYIRLRDSQEYNHEYFKCISCGEIKPFDQMDAGHFISRTHRATRWDEDNVNGECMGCNRFSSDHIAYYSKNLEEKIGKERVDALLVKGRQTKKTSVSELEDMISYYKDKIARMK